MPNVLIIEDDKFLSKIYLTKFTKSGMEVRVAGNGEEGLKMMREEKPDVVLLDLIMPKMDGFEVLMEVKNDSSLKTIPILVLSNLGQSDDMQRAKELGAKEFIIKSDISIQDVVTKIEMYLK